MWIQKLLFSLIVCVIFCALLYYLDAESNYATFRIFRGPSLHCSQSELKLSDVQVHFLRSGLAQRFNLFIIQPAILIQFISSEDLTALTKNKLLPISATNYSGNTLSLGYAPGNNLHDLCSSLRNHNLTDWKCTSQAIREPFNSGNFDITLISSLIGHYLLTNGENIVHVAVFHPRENYLWIDQLTELDHESLIFGRHGRHLYDPFSLETAFVDLDHGQFLPVNVPSEAWYFLSQVDTSTYVPCNHKMAANWKGGRAPDSFLKTGREGVVAIKQLTKRMRMNFWLDSGTLLGWYRQCDVIPYTNDYDFATWARYIDTKDGVAFSSRVLAELKDLNSGLELKRTYGHPGEAYEMALRLNGVQMDLFFAYETDKTNLIGGQVVQNNSYFYYVFPKWTLCSSIFLGLKVLVHCDSERTLRSAYGDHWAEPVKSFHWATEPFNMGPLQTWPPGVEGTHYVD